MKSIDPPDRHAIGTHPLCGIAPAMGAADVVRLKTSMKQRGFDRAFPIVLYEVDGVLYCLDGRNRLAVAGMLGILDQVAFLLFEGTEQEARIFVETSRLARVNMPKSKQMHMILTTREQWGDSLFADELSEITGSSKSSAKKAADLHKASPTLSRAVAEGAMTQQAAQAAVAERMKKKKPVRVTWTDKESGDIRFYAARRGVTENVFVKQEMRDAMKKMSANQI